MPDLASLGKALFLAGAALAALGLLLWLGVPGLGRLPGDVYVRRGNFSLYFPLATSVLLSIVLTLVLNLFLRRR
ncbi:MAG: DUF2905 domain-containing protein [Peptococcaceae bacterium]|jgi:hypothetical protein|nr:DUF2905 domain-containing protein [Peptococcaceae bacterium]